MSELTIATIKQLIEAKESGALDGLYLVIDTSGEIYFSGRQNDISVEFESEYELLSALLDYIGIGSHFT